MIGLCAIDHTLVLYDISLATASSSKHGAARLLVYATSNAIGALFTGFIHFLLGLRARWDPHQSPNTNFLGKVNICIIVPDTQVIGSLLMLNLYIHVSNLQQSSSKAK